VRPARDGSGIPYFLCWASAGADLGRARPYVLPPWGPKHQWSKPYYTWGIFPLGFADKFKTLSQSHQTQEFVLRAVEYFMLVCACVRGCVERDAGLWKKPVIRLYFADVIQKGQWWLRRGGYERKADIVS
jgi:hypothetical protein